MNQQQAQAKICPFQSTADKKVICSSECTLYREKKANNYACPLSELTSISWFLNGKPERQ